MKAFLHKEHKVRHRRRRRLSTATANTLCPPRLEEEAPSAGRRGERGGTGGGAPLPALPTPGLSRNTAGNTQGGGSDADSVDSGEPLAIPEISSAMRLCLNPFQKAIDRVTVMMMVTPCVLPSLLGGAPQS